MMYTGSVRLTGIAQQEFSTRLRSGAVSDSWALLEVTISMARQDQVVV